MAIKHATKAKNSKRTVTPSAPVIVPAIYERVSTEEQAKEGYGLDVQEKRCLAQAIAKGWDVRPEHVYKDEGISGTKDASERPGLAALMTAVQDGEINAVIILSLDRLGRKTMIILDLVRQISSAGAELVSCKESLDTTTPAGRFVLTMFAALAELDHNNTVEKLSSGRDARGERDGEKGGPLPFGYKRIRNDEGKAIGVKIDTAIAPIVRRIDREQRRGTSQRQIAAALNKAGIPGPRGGKWHASSVGEILKNRPSYKGGPRGDSDTCWPAIL